MRFQFPLAAVLQVRLRTEEREETLLTQILAELAKATVTLQEADLALVSAHRDRLESSGASITALEVSSTYGTIENLGRRRAALKEHVERLEQLRDKQMVAYCSARRNREALDQLRDEQRTAFELAADQREQRDVNDIAVRRYVRKKSAVEAPGTNSR